MIKKGNWKLRAGIAIMIFSFLMTPLIIATPFFPIDTKSKVALTTVWIIIGNVTFYGGGFLAGKEVFTKYKARLNPRNWFKKKRKDKTGT
jgi:hypothetical protein